MRAATAHAVLIDRLLQPDAYPHPVQTPACVETHISWVLLTGMYAYKIKKPVALGFLDFSTLALRRAACFEELRLNRRQAAELYLDVVPIAGPSERATVLGAGEPIEYAVRMRQFAPDQQFDRLIADDGLCESDLVGAARRIAQLHAHAPTATEGDGYGTAQAVTQPAEDNFRTLRADVLTARLANLGQIEAWSQCAGATLAPRFEARRRQGRVRECHGDLHLGNLVRLHGDAVPFDCIEFSAALRWIDVMSDIAFLMMDLLHHDRPRLAFALINAYLESGGDYDGVAVLRYYLVYRAMVRAKVAALRAAQLPPAAAAAAIGDAGAHTRLARALTQPPKPALILMHGLSGSGKTHCSGELMLRLPAIRVRSDIERKRLHGYAAGDASGSAVDAGIYSAAAGAVTYRRLASIAATALDAGFTVIVDAACLAASQRAPFRVLAAERGAGFAIVSCAAPQAELRRRLRHRSGDASEAGEAVLDRQLERAEALGIDEQAETLFVDPQRAADPGGVTAALTALLRQRTATPPGRPA